MEELKTIIDGKDVGFLTRVAGDARTSDRMLAPQGFRAWPGFCAVIAAACISLTLTATATASEWQSTEEIANVAEEFAKQRFGKNDGRVTPAAGHLDPRLRLRRCSKSLEAFVRPGTKATSRTVVGVRCTGSTPWKVYVPVDVVVVQPVLLSKRMLPRDHVITADDVVLENRDVSRMTGGYLSSLEELAGHRLKQQITGGRVITPAMLVAEILVRRGQSVTLVVRDGSMNISMAGKALNDGALNQRVRVENVTSGRVVEGLVRSPEYVEILVR